jgi:hypothetical protein
MCRAGEGLGADSRLFLRCVALHAEAFMRMFAPRMLTTKHSYPMHSIINASLKDVDKAIK